MVYLSTYSFESRRDVSCEILHLRTERSNLIHPGHLSFPSTISARLICPTFLPPIISSSFPLDLARVAVFDFTFNRNQSPDTGLYTQFRPSFSHITRLREN